MSSFIVSTRMSLKVQLLSCTFIWASVLPRPKTGEAEGGVGSCSKFVPSRLCSLDTVHFDEDESEGIVF
ncbi:hypothetical protein LINPERPRIM_LOCUS11283, partial [Linum perenne]